MDTVPWIFIAKPRKENIKDTNFDEQYLILKTVGLMITDDSSLLVVPDRVV